MLKYWCFYGRIRMDINFGEVTMKAIVFATNNKNKLKELRSIFPNLNVLSLNELGYDKEIIEDGNSFEENAIIKARQVATDLGLVVVAEDSGLEVEALGGAPGIYSARYANKHGDDEANNQLLIKNLQGIENRKARYVCTLCVYHPSGEYKIVVGTCHGLIIDERRGNGGFGYDPYFYIPEFGKTFAEVPLAMKNTISHRSIAFKKLLEVCNEDLSFK